MIRSIVAKVSLINRPFLAQLNVWWEQNREVAEWLERQQADESIVNRNLNAVRKDAVISQVDNVLKVSVQTFNSFLCSSETNIKYLSALPQDCPDAALDAVIKICEGLSAAHRNVVVRKLAELELVHDGA